MIDFHILHRYQQKSPYIEQAISALNGYNLHIVEDQQNFMESRVKAFHMGNMPYVSYCDDDDIVTNVPLVIETLNNYKPAALYTNSEIVVNKRVGNFFPDGYQHSRESILNRLTRTHQLQVIRRDLAQDAANQVLSKLPQRLKWCFDYALQLQVTYWTDWIYIPEPCYKWRIWNSSIQTHYDCSQTMMIETFHMVKSWQ